jgi:hypothetical protein
LLRKNMTLIIRASESNHWYTREGAPQYTVEAAKGGQRNTTLRDARKMNLVPSVTTVLNVAAKPALLAWMQQQVLFAALTLPRRPDEPEKEYIDRIINDSKEQGRSAADVSTTCVSAGGVSAGGVSAGAAQRTQRKKRAKVSGGALLSLKDLDKLHGQPEPDRRAKITVKAEGEPARAVGSGSPGGGRTKRNV